ncbi:MAG: glutamate--tRNA ligase [Gammaproteobacteria bacterium]
MPDTSLRSRFAPSPTGYLHLGNVRTALFNALLARGREGAFLLRIEDTDRERSSELFVQALQDDLRWLGLDWQEGPEAEGGAGPYRQSEREGIYNDYYRELESRGLAYPCFCSPQELKLSRKAQLAAGQPPRYPGTCARLSKAEVEVRLARGLQPTLRFRVPAGETVSFTDLVRGPQRFRTDDIGDFVIRRSDGGAAFFFCNAVDDALMGVTHVLRGEDHLTNTPRQLLVLQALGLPAPEYGHIALVLGEDGAPLSKRNGSLSVAELRALGYLPEAILNHLARLGHTYTEDGFLPLQKLAEAFATDRLGRAPARHDPMQLAHWQKLAVAQLDVGELMHWLSGHGLGEWVPAAQQALFVEAVRDNISLPEEAVAWARAVFGDTPVYSEPADFAVREAGESFFAQGLDALASAGGDFAGFARAIAQATGHKGKVLYMPLRAALTGETHGPEMARLFPLIGAERARTRLEAARERAAKA